MSEVLHKVFPEEVPDGFDLPLRKVLLKEISVRSAACALEMTLGRDFACVLQMGLARSHKPR